MLGAEISSRIERSSTVPGTEELVINMGPQHPSTHGVLRIILKLDGETVKDVDCDIGYLHRGTEKIGENITYTMFIPYTDRLDYIAAPSCNLAWVQAVESFFDWEIPDRALFIRSIVAELSRIASHLLWLATHALDIGAMTVFLWCFREREMVLDLFERAFGARLTVNAFRLGGLYQDVPQEFLDDARKFIELFPDRVDDYETLLTENRIWLQRTRGVGVISAADALDYGLTGPILRASGVKWDLRRAKPYAAYPYVNFTIPVGENGDVYDRYLVRLVEMRESASIIGQCLDMLPGGPVSCKTPRTIKPPAGEIYHGTENPKGEFGFYIVSDGTETPYRVRIRPPSFINLAGLKKLCVGELLADVIAIIGSIDIVLGECDR
ncbi:MAG: NADH-quinone oxidoreductase subunit D [Nitrospinota bacterium]|jgi:NADH-quinone oxidoreductase subunit D|nr:NADH-quinone oxidoreductase subunit D [Nitrospinota bacterium]MDP7504240.1 NADH-quinone oxidoreductase subunit D [Nitrospinota bacterium]MDP7661893.1 NADH-quinone oxidoreductase subunit D [Nitrospinota bacterium]